MEGDTIKILLLLLILFLVIGFIFLCVKMVDRQIESDYNKKKERVVEIICQYQVYYEKENEKKSIYDFKKRAKPISKSEAEKYLEIIPKAVIKRIVYAYDELGLIRMTID